MKQTDGDAVVLEFDLPEPRDRVWRALTENELLAAWLLPNDIRPEVGAKFQFEPDRAGCKATECEVLEVEPGRALRWRQRDPAAALSSHQFIESVVSFELADLPGGGTHLRVVHDGFKAVTCTATVLQFPARTLAMLASMRKAA
jgi:uncharacterized protein YndB with AHSA1/START domain